MYRLSFRISLSHLFEALGKNTLLQPVGGSGQRGCPGGRDTLADKMSKDELAEARKLAAAWMPTVPEQVAQPDKPAPSGETPPSSEVSPALDPIILFKAADAGDAEQVKQLLEAGADTALADPDGWTPLLFAAAGGHAEVVSLLLEAGAEPNVQGKDGSTPLIAAALGGACCGGRGSGGGGR